VNLDCGALVNTTCRTPTSPRNGLGVFVLIAVEGRRSGNTDTRQWTNSRVNQKEERETANVDLEV